LQQLHAINSICTKIFVFASKNMFGEGSSDSELEDGLCEAIVEKEIKDFLSEPNYFSARTKKKRQRYDDERPSFVSVSWSKLIERREVSNPFSRIGKLFRRRFRLPFPLFLKLVEDCQRHCIFPKTRYIPVALKVLACLRILGRGSCADEIKELSSEYIGESTVHVIFKQFVKGVSTHLVPVYIKAPDGPYLEEILGTYARLGFPGCVGSMDCTHVWWEKCPKKFTFDCTGKEGYPTLAFQVIVDHYRRVSHVSRHFFGASNDKEISNNDAYTVGVMSGTLENIEYYVYNDHGDKVLAKGGYLITDGGYPDKSCFVDPDSNRSTREIVLWSEWLESTRKDVECKYF